MYTYLLSFQKFNIALWHQSLTSHICNYTLTVRNQDIYIFRKYLSYKAFRMSFFFSKMKVQILLKLANLKPFFIITCQHMNNCYYSSFHTPICYWILHKFIFWLCYVYFTFAICTIKFCVLICGTQYVLKIQSPSSTPGFLEIHLFEGFILFVWFVFVGVCFCLFH